jgi:hypothetical protein
VNLLVFTHSPVNHFWRLMASVKSSVRWLPFFGQITTDGKDLKPQGFHSLVDMRFEDDPAKQTDEVIGHHHQQQS